jgi:hypothetical protein
MCPWSAATFKARHAKKLTDAQAEKGAKVANAVLGRDGDEGKAVRVGLAVAKRHGFRAGRKPK